MKAKLKRQRVEGAGSKRCPIVGVGASAGGLEAFTQLLKQLPLDTGFGFVLIQHLDPQHESVLTELLARATTLPVREATDRLRVQANHVYVIPPNTGLTIVRGILKLHPRSRARVATRSIDLFLEALATDQRERAIGVILSGAATDGTLGLEAIKAEGGLTFAQDDSARFDSMPRSAVAAGCVDFVLSPAEIAKELARIARHPYVAGERAGKGDFEQNTVGLDLRGGGKRSLDLGGPEGKSAAGALAGDEGTGREQRGYQRILRLLHAHTGVDFALYKTTTIHRRIMRRVVLNRHVTLEQYANFLRGNAKELGDLFSDALISVTSFFRNPEAFEVLKRKVFPSLLQQRGDEPLRVWVLGCSTGQEAYSIAMAFTEAAEKSHRPRKLQIFATDLSDANLAKARHGLYAKTLAQDVSPERLERFFIEEEGGYRVIKPLRELVVFARQNLINDPPFSRMDLISCRNLMIYLDASLQKKVLPTFHYALNPGGFLFLGASESISSFRNLFLPVSKREKIFSKKAAPAAPFQLPVVSRPSARLISASSLHSAVSTARIPAGPAGAFQSELNVEREADRVTVSQFSPPSVLINSAWQILQFRGSTDAYLEPPTGKATFDLLKMARPGLMLPLRAAINRARKKNEATRLENVMLTREGGSHAVDLEVVPLKNLKERCFLVFFEPSGKRPKTRGKVATAPASAALQVEAPRGKKTDSRRIAALERDLSEAQDYLQSVQENQEIANEELQAANEEGQSANEELQSLNEELETSKEELESTNEELTTVNDEMVSRNTELDRLNSDLTNLQSSANLVIVLIGRDQVIRRFSPQAEKAFNLTMADVGRSVGVIRHNLDMPGVEAFVGEVVSTGRARECEVRHRDGRWYSLRVRPYLTAERKVDGAVLLLMDIDELKKTERLVNDARTQLARHAEELTRLVAERTGDLTATNRKLEALVTSSNQGKEEYRALFQASQSMQKKLRNLARQIITVQEEERKQISRELHDEVVQTLVAVNVELSALDKMSDGTLPLVKAKIAHTQRLVENSVDAVHRFARGLRPAVLDDLGLIPAIHSFCKTMADRKQIRIQINAFSGVEALGSAERTVLFRVAQEALTNVVRHAQAANVKLSIVAIRGGIRMEISDDGKAFDVNKTLGGKNNKRLGLVGMKERLEMVGGTLEMTSVAGTGTTVRAEIPFVPQRGRK